MLTDSDIIDLKNKGIEPSVVEKQLNQFVNGFPFANIDRPATLGDGITILSDDDRKAYVKLYETALAGGLVPSKFVPASGAATRMFKDMFAFLDCPAQDVEKNSEVEPYKSFFANLSKFAFYNQLTSILPKDASKVDVVAGMLSAGGLNYGAKPKGVLSFHAYGDKVFTASMEHLVEAIQYSTSNSKKVNLHFTVSPEHLDLFENSVKDFAQELSKEHDVRFNITYSFQKPSTDTIAVDISNKPFRSDDGKLVFRPAGHGALIENLNELESDLIFIKNIDNVASQHLLADTVDNKKLLAGYALAVQEKVFKLLNDLNGGKEEAIINATKFVVDELKLKLPNNFDVMANSEKSKFLFDILNRPVRVCGMVRNEGEPGGGPFWVKDASGSSSLQVVESAQIDMNNVDQKRLFAGSTHFNPVDLVCCTKDYKGNKFDLTAFVDQQTGFISEKSMGGRPLKALELPGLWNGAMAGWITKFVEVPASTFNPVKTVMDLLRPAHQPK